MACRGAFHRGHPRPPAGQLEGAPGDAHRRIDIRFGACPEFGKQPPVSRGPALDREPGAGNWNAGNPVLIASHSQVLGRISPDRPCG